MPMPTSQRPSRTWPGCGVALVPAEPLGADAQALDELALRERPFAASPGSTWVSLQDRGTRSGSRSELLRHLVHRDLERHHARRFARRAHRIAFGQVEHRRAASPSCGWRPHRAARVCCTAVSGLPPGRSPDQLSWPIAVILPSRSAPMRMRWIVAGRCVVLLNISGRVQRHLDRPAAPRARRARRAARRRARTACRRSRRR